MSSDRPDVGAVTAALDTLLTEGAGLLESHHLDDLAELRQRIDERLASGDALTVVAVAGGTGVGKSALVNRLAGTRVVIEGVRRPTTDHPVAVAAVLDGPARALLDHLDIQDRRVVGDALPDGLVLVDLPDHDSVVADHQRTSERLTRRVDALVVVVDPLKYARADLHAGPLAELSRHAEVVTVALNRSDEMAGQDLAQLRADLADRLEADGLREAEVLSTSAVTGAGTLLLRSRLEELASARTAAVRRLTADAAQLADRIAAETDDPPEAPDRMDQLVEPLLEAVDAGRATAEAEAGYRRAAHRGCRSPLAKLVRFLPARMAAEAKGMFATTQEHSRPVERSAAAIEAALARTLRLGDTVGRTHAAMARTIERVAADAAPTVLDALDAVPSVPRPRWWWPLLATLRGVAEAVAVVGLAWLLLLAVGDWLGLPEAPTPMLTDDLSLPAALFLFGLVTRVVLGLLSRLFIAMGARRHAARIAGRLRRRLTSMLEARVITPVREELERRRTVRRQLDVLRRTVSGSKGRAGRVGGSRR